ncbi:MAG: hypothetical protein AAFX86_02700 [Pseudomonadota bacterium]
MRSLWSFFLLCLSGCSAVPDVELAPQYLQSTFRPPFTVQGAWSHFPDALDGRTTRGQHLTRHGLALDRVWVVSGLRPGQRLVEASAETHDGPIWQGEVLQKHIEGSLWALGYGGVSWSSSPSPGPGNWGPMTNFEALTDRGLSYQGAMRARLVNDRLDLVIWIAEAGVYAPRTQADAYAMLAGLG